MGKIYCSYCERSLSKSYYNIHIKTKKHKKNKLLDIINEENILKFKKCSICLDYIKSENESIKTECNHIFHKTCLKTWLEYGNNCPYCRHILTNVSNRAVILLPDMYAELDM